METKHYSWIQNLRQYSAEVVFFFVLAAVLATSMWLSQFIPDNIYDIYLTPIFNVCTFIVAFSAAWLIFRHTDGLRIRRIWGYVLLAWGCGDLFYLVSGIVAPMQIMNMGAEHLTTYELLIGDLLGWLMILYPTETLRPGWLRWKTIMWQLLPLFVLAALDYILPFSLRMIISLYPYMLLVTVLSHIRAYRVWCENNYSSMDNIDVQWVIRYCIMLFIIGANFVYMCTTQGHTRAFTQQWFVIFMLIYSTEQILFRRDPWVSQTAGQSAADSDNTEEAVRATGFVRSEEDIRLLEQWMETEKPYLNPDLKLVDLRAVLPMNRSYLSQFINNSYGCSFYHFVNRYRIEEAKRLMSKQPNMKMSEVAERAGFSSPNVFSTVFLKETGINPREWSKTESSK